MKKLTIFLFFGLLLLGLIACQEEEPITTVPTEPTDIPTDPTVVPTEPTIVPTEPTIPANCKAVDYEYDPQTISDYAMVWSDEFDIDGMPDSNKWAYDTGGHGWGNNELQYYRNSGNAWVESGNLIIEARKEDYLGREYTSARLVTRGKQSWKYGKFEISAKLPTGRGTWPAIWMLPTSPFYGGWPNSGEIDIMEHVGYDQNKIHGSIHTADYNHKIGTQRGGSKTIATASTEFHKYSIEWLPDRILFYVDDVRYYQFRLFLTCPDEDQWPFDISFHLLLNIAVGGDWGGVQGVDPDVFPQRMEVEYVRVYQSDFVTNLQRG
jgi:beta-glucanase (GH16 family)